MITTVVSERAQLSKKFVADASRPVAILLVEDDEIDRDMITRQLMSWNVTVSQATDKGEALVMASSENFDLSLVDMRLPWEGNGVAVMKMIRQRAPLAAICAYSGQFSTADIAKICHEVGPVTIADKAELRQDWYLRQLFAQFRLSRRAGMETA